MSTGTSYSPASATLNGNPLVLTEEFPAIFKKCERNIGKNCRLKASLQVGDHGRQNGDATIPSNVPLNVKDDDVAWTIEKVCEYMGGSKPTHPATIYKWIKTKGFPKPFKSGPRTSRWLKSEVEYYRRNLIHWRGKPPPVPTGKRKKRCRRAEEGKSREGLGN